MRKSRINFQRRILNNLRRHQRRCADRNNLIVVAVHDERRDIDLLQVFSEIGFGKGLDTLVSTRISTQRALQPERIAESLQVVTLSLFQADSSQYLHKNRSAGVLKLK